VTIFGWSGSAVIGGLLLDRHGFTLVFLVTAAMQFAGSMFIVVLLPVVPAFEAALKATSAEGGPDSGAAARSPDADVREPLLATSASPRLGSQGSSGGWPAAASGARSITSVRRSSFDGAEEVEIAHSFSSTFSGTG
jgi:hypothetical protein